MTPAFTSIADQFTGLPDWESRLRYIIELGQAVPALSASDKSDANRVRGCVSQVWLVSSVEWVGGRPVVVYGGQSDAAIMQGLIALLLALYSGRPTDEIAGTDAIEVFDKLGLREHLTKQRSNGLAAMVKKIRKEAQAATLASRLQVLRHIEKHETPTSGCRVPDSWIEEANASIVDGQTIRGDSGRRLTDAGRKILTANTAQL